MASSTAKADCHLGIAVALGRVFLVSVGLYMAGYIGIMENKMETAIIYRGYVGVV